MSDVAEVKEAIERFSHQTFHPNSDEAVLVAAARRWVRVVEDQPFRIELEDDGRFWPRWACDALRAFFEERGVYWYRGPKRQGVVGAEEVLEVLEKAWLVVAVGVEKETL